MFKKHDISDIVNFVSTSELTGKEALLLLTRLRSIEVGMHLRGLKENYSSIFLKASQGFKALASEFLRKDRLE